MDKRKFEEKIEKSIENAAAHFEQRVESVAAKAEKRIEAAADRFDKSVERATGTRAGKIAVFCINVVIAIALITGGSFLLHYEHIIWANVCFIAAALDIVWRIVEIIIFRDKGKPKND